MTEYLENALLAGERRRFERHLARCPACLRYLADMRQLIQTAGRLRVEPVPEDVVEELVRIYRRLRAS